MKIAVIVHQNKEVHVHELVESLKILKLPIGYEMEISIITGTSSRAKAYNEGMRKSDAKYKLYLDERVRILEPNMLLLAFSILEKDQSIGVLGVAGARVIPIDADCLHARKRLGKLRFGMPWQDVSWSDDGMVDAAVLDGYFLMTREDVFWREDLFAGECFLDIAQCVDMRLRGYQVVVAEQKSPWVQYEGTFPIPATHDREAFLNAYSEIVFPLVTVILLTFNRPQYFCVALESALSQTYRHVEIVVSDDSTDDRTEKAVQPYLEKYGSRIKYVHHHNFSMADNWRWGARYDNPEAEYVNWLFDDDVMAPEKIERMMSYYLEYDQIGLVTSYRRVIDADGTLLSDREDTKPLFSKDVILSGNDAGKLLLYNISNYIGEFTTVLMRKDFFQSCCRKKDFRGTALPDVSLWLRILPKGDLVYIAEPLSYFRIHENQSGNALVARLYGVMGWYDLVQYAWEHKTFLENEWEARKAILRCLALYVHVLEELTDKALQCHIDGTEYIAEDVEAGKWEAVYRRMGHLTAALSNGYVLPKEMEAEPLFQ